MTEDMYVIIHNFMVRKHDWVVPKYSDLVEFAGSLVVLTKRNVPPPPQEMIAWYDTRCSDDLIPGLTVPLAPSPRITRRMWG
jgi:hypothetical protein